MKNKPARHKETNTFQFKPFSERITEIDIDVFHRVAHRNEEYDEEAETHFHQALQKWNVLNLTEGYFVFRKKVHEIVTLPQLLNHKQYVVDNLIESLSKKDSLSLQPILELVVALARDLQKEFYEYFPQFLKIIIDLLKTKDTEQLEYTFTTLAYLFKFLWRYLIRNVGTIFDLLLPLLSDTQPAYINNFAAESFSFVVRKVKDKGAFLKLILRNLKRNTSGITGCGKLLFEVIGGTPGQFHSCAEQMLVLYFSTLRDDSVNQKILYDVLQQIITCVLQKIHPQKCSILWTVLLSQIDEGIKTYNRNLEKEQDCRENSVCLILRLVQIIVEHKNGIMVVDPILLIRKLIQMLDVFKADADTLREVMNVSVAILLASNIKLLQEHSSQLVLKIMNLQNTELIHVAVERLINYSSFESLVLPYMIKSTPNVDDLSLQLLTKIINERAPPCLNGMNLSNWKKFVIDTRHFNTDSTKYFLSLIRSLTEDTITESALRLLVIVPHFKSLDEELKSALTEAFILLHRKVLSIESLRHTQPMQRLTLSFSLTLEALIHILEPEELNEILSANDINIMDVVKKHNDNVLIIHAVDLFLTYFNQSGCSEQYVNSVNFNILHECLAGKLTSPFHLVRLSVTHIYSLFKNIEGLTLSSEENAKTAVELIYLTENEPITVHTCRDKILHLESLAFHSNAVTNLYPRYYDFPFRYIMGNLYVNFSLLWEPVSKLIASYADKEFANFWPLFLSELKTTATVDTQFHSNFECNVLTDLEARMRKYDEKPDYENYKVLLWKCMSHFSQLCQTKNRDLTTLFIDHVNENFFKWNSEDAKWCSIRKREEDDDDIAKEEKKDEEEKGADDTEAMDVDTATVNNNTQEVLESSRTVDDEQSDDEEDNKVANAETSEPITLNRAHKVKLLLAQMELFAKLTNPRTLYREEEVHKIYMDLLSFKNPAIQKAALNCIFTYKYKYVLPYKDYLNTLVDEKNLKNELARFKIDKESNMIQEEHRDGLMPILMRLIYAKMAMKTGMRTGGRAGGLVRKKIILRFLAGTQEDEMLTFVNMAFKPFRKYMSLDKEVDLRAEISNIISTLDLNNVVPPKRMQSAANLLGIIIEQFGAKMQRNLLPRLLGVVLCILANCIGILQRATQVYAGYLSVIRNVRTNCIGILARFFSHFENYKWSQDEIDALYDVAVFPWLEKLPIDGIHSPTTLLKLFIAWSQCPRYFPLFLKHRENDKTMTPLPYIIRLLLHPKTHASVTNAIMDMFEKMLTLQDYGKGEDSMATDDSLMPLTPILNNLLDIDETYMAKGTNYGSVILLPHMPEILQYMENRIKRSHKGVNRTELIILSRVSEFVNDPSLCDTLITLTLPILTKKATGSDNEESVIEFLRTITNLIKHVKNPEVHLRSITPLIGLVSSVPARKLLLQLYHGIAMRSPDEQRMTMLRNSELLTALNAWDQKWIDQPDFQKRLDAFTEISAMSEKNEITLEFGVCIIYNCFYFLKNEGDLALKDCAGQCLKAIGPKLAQEHKVNPVDRRYLLDDTILTITRKGIMNKNDNIRHQSIAFLGHMAMECPEVHPILRDLSLLANKADPEVDFFENMQHLQLHRRVRAMLKFCNVAKTLEKPMNPKTLTQFVLPLASSYLCNETHTNKNSIIDAAIEVVGTICKMLPWYHYEIVLKYYLSKLRMSADFQKQVVRIIVAILDSFHFDLSKYKGKEPVMIPNTVAKEKEPTIESSETEDKMNPEEKLEEALTQDPEEKLEEDISGENGEEETENEVGKTVEKNDTNNATSNAEMVKFISLTANGAKRVISSISNGLLPQLHRAIAARTRHEDSHKVNRKKALIEHEEDDLVRVPIALAVVKLLQKLPEGILNGNLPGIFMKLCTFLKSRLESVRRVTREVLQKIMITLGPNYLHHLLKEMNALLTKGFQVHVLVYTVHAVLVSLKPYFQKFDINNNLRSILSVCKVDLFGLTADEKEIIGVTKNVSEAKSTKSFDIFHILAQYITESCLVDLILPLKEVLAKTNSHKTVQKITDCLRNVALGLADNTYVPLEKMLIFLYGIISESIPSLIPTKKEEKSKEEKNVLNKKKEDCFIIAPEPKSRMGIKAAAKTTKNTNAHVMVEFGLKLYHILLKREKIGNQEYKPFLEPFVPVLSDCLKSHRVKLSSLSLQCLNWLVKMDLTSMRESVSQISTSIFEILHKYAAAGLSKGDNFDLVMAAFKCMSVLIRDVKHFEISAEQLKVLIMYAEQDLHDSDKQATAFTLLKSIIKRKLVVDEMYGVMDKIAELSITSELEHVRIQSRGVFYSYLMQYPLGKHLEQHISFYLSQLSYEVQPGRLSALEMIYSMVTSFPQKTLCKHSGFMFVMLSARLVNDDDPDCRKLCAKCIKEMIERIRYNDKSKLFEITVRWLNDTNVAHRRLAAQLCGIFVSVETDGFESRLNDVVPLLLKQFHARFDDDDNSEPGRFVKIQTENSKGRDKAYSHFIKDPERLKDHHMFQVLQLLLKISAHCTVFLKNEKYKESVRLFAEHTQSLLAHPHLWVRLAATQFIGFVLSSLNIDKVTALLNHPEQCDPEDGYVYNNPVETIRSLALDLIGQLQPDMTFEELGDQVVKNLIFIARLVQPIKPTETKKDETKEMENKFENISLPWLFRRMRKSLNVEITQAPKSTFVRMAMFKWIAGILVTIPLKHLSGIIFNIMSPLVREISTTEESNAPLRQLAKEVMGMLKKRMGTEEYSTMVNQVQRKLDVKKAERKKVRTQQFVTDPELAAKRKIARQQKKKEVRKRKLDTVRGKKPGSRKRPRRDVDLEVA